MYISAAHRFHTICGNLYHFSRAFLENQIAQGECHFHMLRIFQTRKIQHMIIYRYFLYNRTVPRVNRVVGIKNTGRF